jgi:hypothetical protein
MKDSSEEDAGCWMLDARKRLSIQPPASSIYTIQEKESFKSHPGGGERR